MSNPVVPADYHFGSDFGEKFGGGLAEGVISQYEMGRLRKAINESDPNASAFDKMMKIQSLPIRKETKESAFKQFQEFEKNKPKQLTGKDIGSLTDTLLEQFPGYSDVFQSDRNYRQEFQNRLQRSLANDPSQDPYTVGMKLLTGQQAQQQGQPQRQQQMPQGQPQGPGQAERMPLQDVQDTIAGADKGMTFGWGNLKPREPGKLPGVTLETDRLENAFRQSSIGKVLGLHDSERLQELAERNPEGFDGLMDSIGTNLIDAPVYIAMSSVMGPAGAMAALPVIAEASKHTWELARKHAKGGEVTEKDIEKAVGETMQEGLKGAVFGGVAQLRPLQKLVSAVPGGQKFLNSVIARSAIRVGELGVIAPTAANVLAKGELPSKEEIARSSLLSLGFEAADLPGPSKSSKGSKAGEPLQLTGPKGAEPKTTGKGLDSASALRDVQAAAQGIQRKQTADKAASLTKGAFPVQAPKPQAAQAANVPPGSEAQGTVSIPLGGPPNVKAGSPAPEQRAPVARQEAPSQTAPQQNQAAIAELQRGAARVPRPEGQQQQLEPLQEAGRMAQMRGEKVAHLEPKEINPRKQAKTLEAEQELSEKIQGKVDRFEENLRELRQLRKDRLGQQGEERALTDKKIIDLQEKIKEQQKDLRKLDKELKTGRKPVKGEKVESAVTEMRNKMREEMKSPTEISDKAKAKRIIEAEKVKNIISEANRLKNKKTGLPEDWKDSHTIVHDRYNAEYREIIKNSKKEIEKLKHDNSPEAMKDRKIAEKIRKEAQYLLEKGEAEQIIYRHKKGAEYQKEQSEIAAKHKQRGKEDVKTKRAATRSKKDIERLAKQYAEKPTEKLTEQIAEEIGVKPEEVKEATDQAKKAGEKAARKVVEFRRDRTKGEETPKEQKQAKGKELKGEEDLQALKKEAKEKAGEKKQDNTETSRSANREKAERQRLFKVAKEFGNSFLKGKWSDAFLKNPLGKAILGQAALTGFDEVINKFFPEFKKFPKLGILTLLAGGRNAVFRRIVSTVFNAAKVAGGGISTKYDVNAYKEALRARPIDPKRVMEAKSKLTPKQQKEAMASL